MTSRKSSSKLRQDLLDIIMQPSKSVSRPVATSLGHKRTGLPRVSFSWQDLVNNPASDIISYQRDHVETRKGFLDLPFEIREMIYRLALAEYSSFKFIDSAHMEAIYSARESFAREQSALHLSLPYTYESLYRPDLLVVSRLVHEEAAAIFYGQNAFYLPARIKQNVSHWKTYAHLFRKVVVRVASYDLVCGSPRSHAKENFDEDDELTDMTVALNIERGHKCPGFDKVVAAAVENWKMNREMLALLVNLENVLIKVEGGTDVWVDPWALMPLDQRELPLRILPYLKDWSAFMFGETRSNLPSTPLSKQRPVVSAEIDFWMMSGRGKLTFRIEPKGGNGWNARTPRRAV